MNYREAYNMYACNGILFNHESPLRKETFVTRKITRAIAKMALGLQSTVYIGNMDSKRDCRHAKNYVKGMWLMLQQDKPEDLVLATGVTTKIRDFMIKAFDHVGVTLEFKGEGVNEGGIVASSTKADYHFKIGQELIKIAPKYFRPTEVELLVGDPTKAEKKMGWTRDYDLDMLIEYMMSQDLKLFQRDKYQSD